MKPIIPQNSLPTDPATAQVSTLASIGAETISKTKENLLGLLPKEFDFYHMGKIKLVSTVPFEKDFLDGQKTAIVYSLEGSRTLHIVVLIDSVCDTSLYEEAGNIISAKVAFELDQHEKVEWMISPPKVLSKQEFERTLLTQIISTVTCYNHKTQDHSSHFYVLLTQSNRGVEGHA